ncbi:MAG: carboxypeptidase-like regulatory domain-containing protein [Saprospiraceae bacterium]
MAFKKIGLLLFACCLILASCKKDPEVTEVTPTVDPYNIPQKIITASLSGTVVLEDGSPAEGATVYVNNSSLTTDENGVFYFKDITMNEYGTFVKVEKPGYFMGAKMVNPKAGQRAITRVRLLTKALAGKFSSVQGGTVMANGNSEISLPPNGVMTKGGDAYTGNVNVYAKWIDPTGSELEELMPGDLRAVDAAQEFVQLATYGMLAVELESDSGEALQVATGNTATLTFPVPSELSTTAPATIPLWSYNEDNGHWIEEGEATFNGTEYVGEVGHFSFWNCDAPFPVVQIEGTVIDQDGNPIPEKHVKIKINSSAVTSSGITNENGAFSGKIPKDEALTITVKSYGWCASEMYTASIGPFSDDVVLPAITIDLNNVANGEFVNVKGTLLDCDGDPVTDGYLKVFSEEDFRILYPDADGMIDLSLVYCESSTLDLIAYDLANLKKSSTNTYNIVGVSELDFMNIIACDVIEEFIDLNVDGTNFIYNNTQSSLNFNNTFTISGSATVGDTSFMIIELPMGGLGTQSPSYASVAFEDLVNNTYYSGNCQGCPNLDVTITAYGGIGAYVEGNFSGTIPSNALSGTSNLSGTFKVIRNQ